MVGDAETLRRCMNGPLMCLEGEEEIYKHPGGGNVVGKSFNIMSDEI